MALRTEVSVQCCHGTTYSLPKNSSSSYQMCACVVLSWLLPQVISASSNETHAEIARSIKETIASFEVGGCHADLLSCCATALAEISDQKSMAAVLRAGCGLGVGCLYCMLQLRLWLSPFFPNLLKACARRPDRPSRCTSPFTSL